MKKTKAKSSKPRTETMHDLQEQLEELFYLFRAVDDARLPEHVRNAARFMVAHLEEVQIRMDGNKNHARAHVHIKYKKDGHAASYAIDDGVRLAGELPRYYDRMVRGWIVKHQPKLRTLWNTTQSGQPDQEILLEFRTTVYD